MRPLIVIAVLFLGGCATNPRSCAVLSGDEPLEGSSLVAQVDYDSALDYLLDDPEPLPAEPREALIRWFQEQWQGATESAPEGAAVWWFKEPKGGLGYRQGIVVLRGCHAVASRTLIDDN